MCVRVRVCVCVQRGYCLSGAWTTWLVCVENQKPFIRSTVVARRVCSSFAPHPSWTEGSSWRQTAAGGSTERHVSSVLITRLQPALHRQPQRQILHTNGHMAYGAGGSRKQGFWLWSLHPDFWEVEGMGFNPGRPVRLQTRTWSAGIYLFLEFNHRWGGICWGPHGAHMWTAWWWMNSVTGVPEGSSDTFIRQVYLMSRWRSVATAALLFFSSRSHLSIYPSIHLSIRISFGIEERLTTGCKLQNVNYHRCYL